MTKVLLWSPNGSGLHYNGPGTSAYRLFASDTRKRFQIDLVHGFPPQEPLPLFNQVHCISKIHPLSAWTIWQFQRKGLAWLKQHARNYDVFYGLDAYELTVPFAYQAQKLGLPSYIKIATHPSGFSPPHGFLRRLVNLPKRRQKKARHLSGIVAISQEIVQELHQHQFPEDKIIFIPNGVDTDIFFPAKSLYEKQRLRQQLGLPIDAFLLLFVGGLTPRKQPHWLPEILHVKRRECSNIHAVIVGPERFSGYEETLRNSIQQYQVTNRVTLFDHTPNVADFYRAVDLFILPSKQEGMPNAVLEAMASGLPCIVTPVSGSRELIEPSVNGFHTESVEDAAHRVAQYYHNSNLCQQHGQQSISKVHQHYSSQIILDQYEQLFTPSSR